MRLISVEFVSEQTEKCVFDRCCVHCPTNLACSVYKLSLSKA